MSVDGSATTVAVLTEVAAVTKALDYMVPDTFTGPLEPGSRVRVPLHGRSVRGWVLGPGVEDPSTRELKAVRSSLGYGPPGDVIEISRWAAWRWSGTPARFLATGSPERIVHHLPRRPAPPRLEAPAGELGATGASLSISATPSALRIGPTTDPMDLVLGFLAGLHGRGALDSGSALILVPGLGYAARLVSRLSRRGIPAVDAASSWEAARAGWPVVVGTRTAAFAPVPSLAGVVVLDAEDSRYTSEATPTWNAPLVAIERARRAGAPALLVSSSPSPLLASAGPAVTVPRELERGGWPHVVVADRGADDPRTGVLSSLLAELARDALETQPDGVAVACIVNRTGRAKLLICSRCSEIARCEACDAACALDDVLRCPRCGASRPVICSGCGATHFKLLRPGTAQLAAELGLLLGVPVAEVTASATADVLDGARAVVGTEAVLNRVRRCTLVAFLDFDHHLLAPRVGAELGSLSLLGRAGRLVGGRGDSAHGTVLIQTKMPDHAVVRAAHDGDPEAVLADDLALRQQLGLPPFCAMASLRGDGAAEFAGRLSDAGLSVTPLGEGAFAAVAASTEELCDVLAGTPRPKGPLRVAVDPESI